jgi:hypothetical protein
MNNIPGFNGEASLSPNIGTYRGTADFGGSGKGEILPMLDFSSAAGFAGLSIFRKTLICCSRVLGHIYCRPYQVPIFENCRCQNGFPLCTPPVLQQ